MGRPKEFEPNVVLDRATEIFWQKGYEATSIEDLVQAMGIQRGSIYAAFGSKRDLFLASLGHYRERSLRRTRRLFAESTSPLAALERSLQQIVDQAFEQNRRWGCLMTNSSVELAASDREVRDLVAAHRGAIESCFAAAIRNGQTMGEIRADESPEALSSYLVSIVQGLRVMSKTAETQSELEDIIRIAIDSLRQ